MEVDLRQRLAMYLETDRYHIIHTGWVTDYDAYEVVIQDRFGTRTIRVSGPQLAEYERQNGLTPQCEAEPNKSTPLSEEDYRAVSPDNEVITATYERPNAEEV